MLSVFKECRFDAAHILTNHSGQCKNLHGHTYRVIVEVQAVSESQDMVIDFKDLKHLIEKHILSRFDHSFIYDKTSESQREIAAVISKYGMRSVALPFRSTAENLARYFYEALSAEIPVAGVKVYETPDSCAEYRKNG